MFIGQVVTTSILCCFLGENVNKCSLAVVFFAATANFLMFFALCNSFPPSTTPQKQVQHAKLFFITQNNNGDFVIHKVSVCWQEVQKRKFLRRNDSFANILRTRQNIYFLPLSFRAQAFVLTHHVKSGFRQKLGNTLTYVFQSSTATQVAASHTT